MTTPRTPLSGEHEQSGARMADFAGTWMPLWFSSIVQEARHVRTKAGLFDLCHMGRIRISGDGALQLVDRLVTCDVAGTEVGRVRYGLLTRDDGTIIDDVLVYREQESALLCVNAVNRKRDLAWLESHATGTSASVSDITQELAMIAVSGPDATAIVARNCADDPAALRYYTSMRTEFCGLPCKIP